MRIELRLVLANKSRLWLTGLGSGPAFRHNRKSVVNQFISHYIYSWHGHR